MTRSFRTKNWRLFARKDGGLGKLKCLSLRCPTMGKAPRYFRIGNFEEEGRFELSALQNGPQDAAIGNFEEEGRG